MTIDLLEPSEQGSRPLVTVVWSPGVGRDLAHRLIEHEGLPTFGVRVGEASVTNHCAVCGSSEHGRPALTPLRGLVTPQVSISYAHDLTMVALTEAGPVGVDVERIDATESFTRFDTVVMHEDERTTEMRSRTMTWVRKESLLKATGLGLRVDPRQIRLSEPDESPELITWSAPDGPGRPVWMYDVEVASEHVAAVTVLGVAERPPLAVRRVDLEAQPRRASD